MNGRRTLRAWIAIAGLSICLLVALIYLRLTPPDSLSLAAGPQTGGYHQVAVQYRDILARDDIALQIIETAGSAENAELIASGQVDAALLQGGIRVDNATVEAIASIFYEPMIFLTRRGADLAENPTRWDGLRINIGHPQSGTAIAFADFERAVGMDPDRNTRTALGYDDAIAGLVAGEVDIAVFVAPFDAPYLKTAFENPTLGVLRVAHTEAISRRLEYAATVTVPTGAVSLDLVVPTRPVKLLALDARLAIDGAMHPALVNRLNMAALELHGGRGIVTDQGTFPTVEGTEMPVNNAARQLILNGPSIWHDWLPYWMASQVHRMILLLLPILFIFAPALRAAPSVYAYVMGWRVWQHYPEIKTIEESLSDALDDPALVDLDNRLVELDERLSALRVPAAYRNAAYHARMHIGLVRNRIAQMREAA